MATAPVEKFIGMPLKRKEDPRLIQGLAHYADDITLPGMLHAVFVRSPYAHARVRSVNTSNAKAAPGVVAVITAADLGTSIGMVPCAAVIPDMKSAARPVLAKDRVRFVGEAVAVVVAEDRYGARDAAELVEVDYEALTPVVDPEKAIAKGAQTLYDQHKDNVAFRWELEGGDVNKAFEQADKIVKQRMINQRLIPVAMETRGVVADYKAGEKSLTIWSSTQIPHLLRTQVAAMLGVPEYSVRVITPEVGGGFGSKLNVYPEEALVGYLAMHTGRPVKWIESRRENFQTAIHGRDQIEEIELAFKRDGTILGLRCRIIADLGAYYQLLTPLIPTLTGLMICGLYKIPAARVEITGVLTNKMATDAYRGAGRPEATYIIERAMDVAAAELKKDPLELRRMNLPLPKEFPYATPTGLIYDSANYQGAIDLLMKKVDYKKLRAEQAKLRKEGRYIGIGVSTYVEICAMGPSSAMPAGGWESATVRIEPTGKVNVLTGASPHGQGQETSFSQVAADMLGLEPDDILITHGDTAIVPYGIGTFGSRGTAVGGTAVYKALVKLREKLSLIAAHLLGVEPGEMVIEARKIYSKKQPKKSIGFQDCVMAAYVAKSLPAGVEPGLDATDFYEPTNFTFPFGAHLCVVEVDAETGDVRLDKYVAVDDCGNVLNPLLVDGQVHGGIVQSVGQALLEEAVYDDQGQLITGELTDYAIPRAGDIPWILTARTVTPSPVNPMGVKGVGEAGTIGATPCLANAVADALAPFGVKHVDMPFKREKIWRLMHEGKRSAPPGGGAGPGRAKAKAKPKTKSAKRAAAKPKAAKRRRAR
ncbi:MAG TPA: xanthine dehydrogenase family protein molybdopterin-binding subunit [Candidatus Acidoferrales bacterium]|jgi:carbon-monoxide dehydrogenase large subunit|nr:xanthine dehydrogenase family protein molybdopterin-binding subunit [Candidatus Acidoferrales bacterium]